MSELNTLLKWDQSTERLYETGIDRGVLYPQDSSGTYPKGVAWNGLTGVTEKPSGADTNDIYADNIKYLALQAAEDFGATLTCYTYPDEWMECDGSAEVTDGVVIGQQDRQHFGLCYRTIVGNDTEGNNYGYKIHLIYNCTATPSERAYKTVNNSPEAIEFSYELKTTPIDTGVPNKKPSAQITIDSTKVTTAANLTTLEQILYGTPATTDPAAPAVDARLPLPEEVIAIIRDGSYTQG